MPLNNEQQKAVDYTDDRALKVLAGAGTGKTQVLTQRFINLVKNMGHRPQNILCLTFTVKAANEMKQRIIGELINSNVIQRESEMAGAYISNFHSFCKRLISEYSFVVEADPEADIIGEDKQVYYMQKVCREFLDMKLEMSDYLQTNFDRLPIKNMVSFSSNMLSLISSIKDSILSPDEFRQFAIEQLNKNKGMLGNDLYSMSNDKEIKAATRKKYERLLSYVEDDFEDERLVVEITYVIYKHYQKMLLEQNKLDYGDLLYYACRLLRKLPEVSSKFSYILVDEFQDTNNSQYELLSLLAGKDYANVTVVGDKKQSIYEWREAQPENVDRFPGEEINLVANYRSSSAVLDLAHDVIIEDMPGEAKLHPGGDNKEFEKIKTSLFCGEDRKGEASYIAEQINQLFKRGVSPSEIVILMRSVAVAPLYSDVFHEYGIHTAILGSAGFFEQNVAKDLIAMVKLISNPYDDLSWTRVLISPIYSFSDYELHQAMSLKKNNSNTRSLFECITKNHHRELEKYIKHSVGKLYRFINESIAIYQNNSLGKALHHMLSRSGYLKKCALSGNDEMDIVETFFSFLDTFFAEHITADVNDFLSYLAIVINTNLKVNVENSANKVSIMTIHQSKGLEFPYVFICNVRPQSFPMRSSLNPYSFSKEYGLVLTKSFLRADMGPTNSKNVKYSEMVKDDRSLRQKMEEKRILYVAITRAKYGLYITSSEGGRGDSFYDLLEERTKSGLKDIIEVSYYSAVEDISKANVEEENTCFIDENKVLHYIEHFVADKKEIVSKPERELIKLSFSQLSVYDICPLKYKYRYITRIPVLTESQTYSMVIPGKEKGDDAVFLGELMHRILQFYHYEKRKNDIEESVLYEKLSAAVKQHNNSRNLIKKGKDILDSYLKSNLAKRDSIEEEKPFSIWCSGDDFDVILRGSIDRVDLLNDQLQIIDYKTNIKVEKDKYRKQLAIYKLALKELYDTDKKIKTSLYFLRTNKEIELEFSDRELDNLRGEILDIAKNIHEQKFDKGNKAYCKVCEFSSFCPEYSEPRVVHEQGVLF